MSAVSQTSESVHVVRGRDGDLRPLYPAARLRKGNLVDLEQAIREARSELDEARGEIARLREEFVVEIATRRRELADEAERVREQARREGGEQARREFVSLLAAAQDALEALRAEYAADVQRLAFRLARKILDAEFTLRPESMVRVVEAALERAKYYREITVVLHPDDLDRVSPHRDRLLQNLIHCDRLEFRADAELPRHSVRLDTNRGILESILDRQFEDLAERWFEAAIGRGAEIRADGGSS